MPWNYENNDDAFVPKTAASGHKNGEDAYKDLLRQVQERIARNRLFDEADSKQGVIEQVADEIIETYRLNVASAGKTPLVGSKEQAIQRMVDDIIGWNVLTGPMNDPAVEEIRVDSTQSVSVYRAGNDGWEILPGITFDTPEDLRNLVNSKADHRGTGKPINEANPLINAQLPDGSRLHAVYSPIAVARVGETDPSRLVVTIRRFRSVASTLDEMVSLKHMSAGAGRLLAGLMRERASIVIVGGTSSGKTTFLNALLAECDPLENVITCEDTPEVQIAHARLWTRMQTKEDSRPNAFDGIDMARLVKETLRMRPDRIIIGEVRDGAMGAVLQAGNTGHDGIIFTVHANDPWAAISRMETLALMDKTFSNLPIYNVRQMITTALHFIVHVGKVRTPRGLQRRLLALTEIRGIQGDSVQMEDILKYDAQRDELVWTGSYLSPERQERFEAACPGFDFRRDLGM